MLKFKQLLLEEQQDIHTQLMHLFAALGRDPDVNMANMNVLLSWEDFGNLTVWLGAKVSYATKQGIKGVNLIGPRGNVFTAPQDYVEPGSLYYSSDDRCIVDLFYPTKLDKILNNIRLFHNWGTDNHTNGYVKMLAIFNVVLAATAIVLVLSM